MKRQQDSKQFRRCSNCAHLVQEEVPTPQEQLPEKIVFHQCREGSPLRCTTPQGNFNSGFPTVSLTWWGGQWKPASPVVWLLSWVRR